MLGRQDGIVALSYERLLELMDEYKPELGIERWTIGLAIRRGYELDNKHGHVRLSETNTQAFVRLLDPRDANPEDLLPYDMEVTLVHELLHVAFACFTYEEDGSHADIVQEQAIDRMSRSFVALKRRLREVSPLPGESTKVVSISKRKAA